MKFLVDENVPRSLIDSLRTLGHEVVSAKESYCGGDDSDLLTVAQNEERVLITLDKDFGELTFRDRKAAYSGIVLFRLFYRDPDVMISRMFQALMSREDWAGHFSVVTEDRIRMRPLR